MHNIKLSVLRTEPAESNPETNILRNSYHSHQLPSVSTPRNVRRSRRPITGFTHAQLNRKAQQQPQFIQLDQLQDKMIQLRQNIRISPSKILENRRKIRQERKRFVFDVYQYRLPFRQQKDVPEDQNEASKESALKRYIQKRYQEGSQCSNGQQKVHQVSKKANFRQIKLPPKPPRRENIHSCGKMSSSVNICPSDRMKTSESSQKKYKFK